jgi:hypothetical protein
MDLDVIAWNGVPCLKAARRGMRSRSRVDIVLPLEVHHALFRHLNPAAPRGAPEALDTEGGPELLAKLSEVAGLEELAQLAPMLERARYRVRLTSPDPCLRLLPPRR